ncbi:hypothetical protein Tco_0648322 [Tanacetum coccineum]
MAHGSQNHRDKIVEIDQRAERSPLSVGDIDARTSIVKSLTVLEHKNIKDLRQKAKVKWSLEGDENSGFFHGNLFKTLTPEQNLIIENPFTPQEIKDAIWDCGGEKAPGPDGFSFKLIKKYWDILGSDIIKYVSDFHLSPPHTARDKVPISHLQFADDALFIGQWSLLNAKNMSRILTYFHLASGLKVNFNKSKLFGIGVHTHELNSMADSIGCQASQLPCTYLGLPIGANMSRCSNWSPLIERFNKRLSKWKCKTLSYGGRLTLIKSVLGSLGSYYFSTYKAPTTIINKLESIRRNFFWGGNSEERKIAWIAWDKFIAPLAQGGLNIGILKVLNQAMLAKWWWRFLKEENALWTKVIASIYGPHGGLTTGSISSYKSGPWYQIMKLKDDLLSCGISLPSLFKRKIGNGLNTKFWLDSWIGGPPICNVFPRLYRLDKNNECLVVDRAPLNVPASTNIDAPVSLRVSNLGPRSTSPTAIELSANLTLPIPRACHSLGSGPDLYRQQQNFKNIKI